ncbi:MAG: U32 family peptidase [Clostridia bacterium]|nr:U32 family peptidase [Oscillospiraceae bacterium]MBO5569775.1 U32 family peptidase [Clostridia bacterium]
MALCYGADAVYLAGREFGMRAAAANFDDESLRRAVSLAHRLGKKVYVTVNTLPREEELNRLPAYLEFLQDAKVDALIVCDLGVIALAKRFAPKVALHVSTQLGVVNSATANVLHAMGADTVVLARELSLEEIRKIRANTPSELRLEAFVHGAMCISFSGRCLLSNYLTGRDANRGECAQPCRWKYALVEEKRPGQYFEISEDGGTFIMNSQDLNMIEHLQDLADAGVSSFKIEGRTKSAYYTAAVTNAYRHAIDAIAVRDEVPEVWVRETEMVSHRPYCTGFYLDKPGQVTEGPNYFSGADVMAVVERCDEEGNAVLTQRNKFSRGDTLELLTPENEPVSFVAERLFNTYGEEIEDARHAMMEVHMHLPMAAPRLSIVRKRRSS